jgi:hypothetical protein
MGRAANYPAARPRAVQAAPAVAEKFERYESFLGTATDTRAFLGEFSGVPDAIDISALVNPVLVTLADKVGREESVLAVPVNSVYRTHLARPRVFVQTTDVALLSVVTVVGKWASRDEPS